MPWPGLLIFTGATPLPAAAIPVRAPAGKTTIQPRAAAPRRATHRPHPLGVERSSAVTKANTATTSLRLVIQSP